MKNKPQLNANEEVILNHPGFYKNNLRSGWKPGHLYLTNTRIFLWQPARIIFQTLLANIKEIGFQRIGFILRSKDALCISCNSAGTISQAWIMVKDMETWKNKIFERTLLEIDQDGIDKTARELDTQSRSILFFVWQNRHATINELASLYDAPNHMDVLHRIRNIINPTSQRVIGVPALAFERSRIDEPTGEKVLFSWWIIGNNKREKDKEQSLLDIFDEGDHLNIILELKGAQEDDILLGLDGDKLILSCQTPETNYYEEIELPSKVDRDTMARKYHNNILEVRLQKVEDGERMTEVRD